MALAHALKDNNMDISPEALAAWSISTTKARRLKKVTEYIDMSTGEIIPADDVAIPVLDLRTKQADKEAILRSLRPEVRAFAYFVLGFANKRRGITPGIDRLCHWYADLTGKRACDVRRYIPKLYEAGVLAGENLLGRLFQRTGGTIAEQLGEDFAAACRYMMQRAQRSKDASRPDWLKDAHSTMLTRAEYDALMARLMAPASVSMH